MTGPAPAFAPGVRLRHCAVRQAWILQGPELVVVADEAAAAVLRLVDGRRSGDELVAALQADFDAEPAALAADVEQLLGELRQQGLLR